MIAPMETPRTLPERRTGKVRVVLKNGERIVDAESFGAAAAQVACGPGQIVRFEWVTG